ncbi:MAG: hypothetical protein COB38_12070 [Gammaproteobacteria bacterium]|nr:MAG: hypothetical protein COB38_12070 [Gammaproteobacteria bacterium]
MASINVRSNRLVIDFRYRQQRCREKTGLEDTLQNRKRLQLFVKKMEAEITLGTFEYGKYFPNSNKVDFFENLERKVKSANSNKPLFKEFAEVWFNEKQVEWRASYKKAITGSMDKYLIPKFGDNAVDEIKKSDILLYRSELAKIPRKVGGTLSGQRINKILMPLRMIINEAADRYDFITPWQNIKPLKVKRTDVEPFSLDEVLLFLSKVRKDFKNYYTVRFFTGLRTSEIDGLTWEKVDFDRKHILIHQAFVLGTLIDTKTDGSFRTVDMSSVVFDALKAQEKVSKNLSKFVFCNGAGAPINYRNVSRRVWHPTLRYLGLKARRAYQTRHTAATIWLASGESIEWIARQMGHVNSSMIVKVYSRYVPNLTRKDGSVFEALLDRKMNE